MRKLNSSFPLLASLAIVWSLGQPVVVNSQEPAETIRVNTHLAQVDVVVLDKNGQFVDGLKPGQFELRVNGRSRRISSFDRIAAGSANEEERMAAARGQATGSAGQIDRGRTILFYLDDYHLSTTSIGRTRDLLNNFVDHQMSADDQVALITATGQLGFLEQFLTEPSILHRAINKLAHRSFSSGDAERTPMSESEAAAIMSDDRRVVDYFVDQILKEMGMRPRGISTPLQKSRTDAETAIKSRARSIIEQSTSLSVATLTGLERLLRLTATMPWRKTLFFVSDGFMIHSPSNPGTNLRRVTSAAAHAATVIYSIDAQGLITANQEASRKTSFNYGRTSGVNNNSIVAQQEPLQTLAVDSGGKAILNTNAPEAQLDQALKEGSNYYLLTWHPEEEDITEGKFQNIEVNVAERGELTVRTRHGYSFQPQPAPSKKNNNSSSKKRDEEKPLPTALHSLIARFDLPLSLSVGYTDGNPNMLVTATIEVPLSALGLNEPSTNGATDLDLMGAGVDEHGKPVVVFDQDLAINLSQMKEAKSERVLYSHQFALPAGLYQVRVALQDKKANRIGTAMQWIEIPNPQNKAFSLSSLFIGEFDSNALQTGKLAVNASHRFRSRSTLGFFVVIYNAAVTGSESDVALMVQVFRDSQPVITKPLMKTATSTGVTFTYGEDLPLEELPAGKYVLEITAIDRIAKTSARQRARFIIF